MLRSPGRTSAKTGVAPQWTITFAVAGQVSEVVTTSSPGPTPRASRARCSAAVPEEWASTCSASRTAAARRSSSAARGPLVSQPDRIASAAAATSSSPTAGGWKDRNEALMGLDEGARIGGQEAYALRRGVSPRHGPLARPADGEHGARAVGAAPERCQHVAGLAVDPRPEDAGEALRHLDRLEHPRRRDEEARHRPADPFRVRARHLLGGRRAPER